MVRLALWVMALVCLFAIGRVLLGATGSDPADEWMRWAPSVDLRGIEDGTTADLGEGERRVFVRALTGGDVEALGRLDPARLHDPASLETRVARVEIDGRTRRFVLVRAVAPGGRCAVAWTDGRWNDPCSNGLFDAAGRALRDGVMTQNLEMPPFDIRAGTLHLRPDLP